jgi:hypothetical protein
VTLAGTVPGFWVSHLVYLVTGYRKKVPIAIGAGNFLGSAHVGFVVLDAFVLAINTWFRTLVSKRIRKASLALFAKVTQTNPAGHGHDKLEVSVLVIEVNWKRFEGGAGGHVSRP